MKPILYPPEEREFNSNGLGVLSDAISCVVTWEGNGIFDLTMEYPMGGIHFDKIADRCIIMAIPTPYRDPQPFRIVDVIKNMDGTATITANHVAYDLAGVPVEPFTAANAPDAFAKINQNTATESGFNFWTNLTSTTAFSVVVPTPVWSILGGSEGSLLDVYGGEYEFDRWTVKLYNKLGQDNGAVIRYGKNLTDLEQERNLNYLYTGVFPYWADQDGNVTVCDEKIIPVEGSFNFVNIFVLDLSSEFEDKPTSEQLKSRTQQYIKDNDFGKPRVSITLTHEILEQTDEYAGLSLLERCSVFDTVHVQFEELGVDATARITSAETDVLRERYNSLKVGSIEANISDTIAGQQTEIQKRPTVSSVQKIAEALASTVTGAKGGAVRLLDKNGDKMPDEFYIGNNEDPAKATKVWRFNYEGFAGSKNGYNGPFSVVATFDGMYADFIVAGTLNAAQVNVINLVADNITSGTLDAAKIRVINLDASNINTGTLNADLINAGTLKSILISSNDGSSYWNLSTGQAVLSNVTASGAMDSREGSLRTSVRNGGLYSYINEQLAAAIYGYTESNQDMGSMRLYGLKNDGGRSNFAVVRAMVDGGAIALYDPDDNLQLQVTRGVVIAKGLGISGEKNRIVDTSFGKIKMHAVESPQPNFVDFGCGECDENGLCILTLDGRFAETVSQNQAPVWMVTPTGPGQMWVENGYFATVHGEPHQTFNWCAACPQRGYEDQYADPWGVDKVPDPEPVGAVAAGILPESDTAAESEEASLWSWMESASKSIDEQQNNILEVVQ